MNRYLLTVASLIIGFTAHAQSSEQAVLDLSKNKFGWMIRMKYDSLESVLDDRLLFVHSNGWTENKQELIQDIKSGKLRYVNIDITESTARLYTNTAIVTGKGKYIVNNGKWLLTSRHANRLP